MKKLFYFVAVVALTACSNADLEPTAPHKAQKAGAPTADLLTVEEAVAVANNAALMLDSHQTKPIERKADAERVALIGADGESTGLYAVNYSDDHGYAIVSTKRLANPLLAIIPEGSLTSTSEIDNPGFQMFLDRALEYEGNSRFSEPDFLNRPYDAMYVERFDTIASIYNATPNWNASYPNGIFCINQICGCGPLALSLACAYVKGPNSICLTYNNDSIITLPWNNILADVRFLDFPEQEYNDSEIKLAHLCRELGYRMNAYYRTTETPGTGVLVDSLRPCIAKLFAPRQVNVSQVHKNVLPNLETDLNNGVIIGTGYCSIHSDEAGHTFVIDGYMSIDKYHDVYIKETESSDFTFIQSFFVENTKYQHINWGWNGDQNGYFVEGAFTSRNHNFEISFQYFSVKKIRMSPN